ncbi:alpha/beta fold hydrolase, partial [Microbacterium sp. A84]|uniref:alpha/beta fold hydrolase n=1 Tax=Microbacterium sp. A84 TaxID=3450715 RepID=UPI003F43AA2D
DDLRPTRVPTVLIRGDDGLVDADMERRMLAKLGRLATSRTISDCGHHVPLERPDQLIREVELALTTPIRSALTDP